MLRKSNQLRPFIETEFMRIERFACYKFPLFNHLPLVVSSLIHNHDVVGGDGKGVDFDDFFGGVVNDFFRMFLEEVVVLLEDVGDELDVVPDSVEGRDFQELVELILGSG